MSRYQVNVETGENTIIPLTSAEVGERATNAAAEAVERSAEQRVGDDNFTFDGVMLVIAKAFHNHENRVRALEGKSSLTLKQVVAALRKL